MAVTKTAADQFGIQINCNNNVGPQCTSKRYGHGIYESTVD